MGSIVIHGSGQGNDSAEGLERLAPGEPEPGTYWRSKDAVPEKTRDRASAGFFKDHPIRTWNEVARAALPAGSILLLQSTHRVEGNVHTLVTAGEPSVEGDPAREWLYDEFVAHLEPVSDAEAREDRRIKADAAMARISEIQGQMAGIASRTSQTVNALPPPGAGRPTTPGAFTVARERAEERALVVKRQVAEMEEANKSLSRETSRLVAIQSEKAKAAVASVQDALMLAEASTKAAETLDVFGGKKVEVIPIREGSPAAASEPVRLYQNRLFLDEELAVFLHKEGFDHRDIEALPRIVARHPALVDRMIPDRRGVALVRIRRGEKRYAGEHASIAEILAQIDMQRADKEQFLLVKDGDRLSLVFVEVALQEAQRLFPTVDEMDRPFRGTDGVESIGFDDTRYVKALGEFERQALVYKRLLVLLWGLQFNDAKPMGHVGSDGEVADWYSPEWQARNLVFVYDDATRSLPDARPDIHQWIAANMATLNAGSRVVVDWDRAITPESAPSCATYKGNDDRVVRTHGPRDPISIATVRRQGVRLVVDVPVFQKLSVGKASFVATVWLNHERPQPRWPSYLVLDALSPDDFEHYMESRISREHYLDYLPLFTSARRALAGEFAEIRNVDAAIAEELGGDLPQLDAASVRKAVADAHRMWRSESAGKPAATATQRREVKDAAFMVASQTPTDEGILAICGLPRERVLMAGVTGRGRIVVLTDGPADPLLRSGAWVRRFTYRADRKGNWDLHSEGVENLFRERDPGVVERISTDLSARVEAGRLPEGIVKPADSLAIQAGLLGADGGFPLFSGPPERLLAEYAERMHRLTYVKRPKGTWGVVRPKYATVIAAVTCLKGSDRRPVLRYLAVTADPLSLAAFDRPESLGRIATMFQNIYEDGGEAHLKAVQRHVDQAGGARDRLFELCAIHPDLVEPGLRSGRRDVVHHYSFDRVDLGKGLWRGIAQALGVHPGSVRSTTGKGYEEDAAPIARLVASGAVLGWLGSSGRMEGERPAWFECREIASPLA